MSEPTLEITGEGNHREITTKTNGRITTIEDLIAYCNIDLSVWQVTNYVENKWEMGAKGPDGEILVTPLWQVKAWLSKREPEPVEPVVRPVSLAYKRQRKREGRVLRDIRTALVVPDPQIGFRRIRDGTLDPFHDRRALDLSLQLADRLQPDKIVFLGDTLDLADWSDKFLRRPEFVGETQAAVIEAAWWLGQFRSTVPTADIAVLEGNHDARAEKMMITHLRQAYGLKPADELHLPPSYSIPRLLALHELDIEYVGPYPDGQVWINPRLVCEHGDKVRSGKGTTVKAVLTDAHFSVIHGHIHRDEHAAKTVHRRDGSMETIRVYSPGCVCRIDGAVPGRRKRQQWQQGVAVVYYLDAGPHQVLPVAIDEGRALFEGMLFKARNVKRKVEKIIEGAI